MKVTSSDAKLPRGPHRLSRAEVLESQRGRLYVAMLDAVAERGYQPVTVADLVSRAQISRRTFYELFDTKEECFAAAFELIVDLVGIRLNNAIRSAGQLDWEQLVRTSLTAYLTILTEEPAVGRALHIEALIAGPPLIGYRRRMITLFADRMRAARALGVHEHAVSGELPDEVFEFLIGGIDDRIRDCLHSRGPGGLLDLEPGLSNIALLLLSSTGSPTTPDPSVPQRH